MKATTPKFKQIMASGNARDYVIKVDLTLADDPNNPTVLHLTEEDIWNDSFSLETASSSTSSFDIGCAIIGQCKFALNNFDERFNQYDFFNAEATVWVGLVGDESGNPATQQYYRMGFFTVDEPTYAGSLISLVLLDNMWKFDVPLADVSITYPATAREIVLALCSHCDVTLDQTENFHGYNLTISEAPEGDMNCREMLQYVAMLGCNFCEITPTGQLKLRWYDVSSVPEESDLDGGTFDTDTTPYSDGDSADGGNFTDYTSGDSYDGGGFNDNPNVAYFTRLLNSSFGTDVITITGVRFIIDDVAYDIGDEGYVLELENPLVNADNVDTILNSIWDTLENFSLRTYNITTVSDLSVEIGDCCAIKDYKGNYVYSWITCNTFKFTNHTVQCNAVNPTRTLTKRYTKIVQSMVDMARKVAEDSISDYDVAVQELNRLTNEAMGAFSDYEDIPTGGRYYYVSNMPITKNSSTGVCSFEPGSTVFRLAGDVLSISRDGGQTWVNGYNPQTGELIVNVLDAIGINAEWIKAGQVEADRMATNVISAINAPKSSNCYLTFDSRCMMESPYDYVQFFYIDNGTTYASQQWSGATLAGKTVVIPSTSFYVYFSANWSVSEWGIKVTDGGLGSNGDLIQFATGTPLPSVTPIDVGDNVTYIETAHPYSASQKTLWLVEFSTTSLEINGDRININGTVTLTDFANGMATGSTVISGDCIKTGTLDGINVIVGETTKGRIRIENNPTEWSYGGRIIGSYNSVDGPDIRWNFYDNLTTLEIGGNQLGKTYLEGNTYIYGNLYPNGVQAVSDEYLTVRLADGGSASLSFSKGILTNVMR